MVARRLTSVASVETISHHFTDIFGQFIAVLYRKIGEALTRIETIGFLRRPKGRLLYNARSRHKDSVA